MIKNLFLRQLTFFAAISFTTFVYGQNTVIVSDCNIDGWKVQTDGGSTLTFVNGPATPPLGGGSAQFSIGPNGDDDAQLRNPNYAGTKLSALTTLKYSTFTQSGGSGGQAVYIILNVDYDNNGTIDDLLFFEPVYQNATYFPSNPQAPVTNGTWQTWDALNGGWWSVNGTAGAGPGSNVKPLSAIIAAEPNATIVNSSTGGGGVRLVTGFGAPDWNNFIGNADAFKIGVGGTTTTYDFEHCSPCGKNNEKVLVCHNGQTLCIDRNAVKAHLAHGDNLGPCPTAPVTIRSGDQMQMQLAQDKFTLVSSPNPFKGTTKLDYSVPVDSRVVIKVYDMLGREVSTVINADKKAGTYSENFDGSKLTTGVYYARMIATADGKQTIQTQKLVRAE